MSVMPLGPEVASRVEAMVGRFIRPSSDGFLSKVGKLAGLFEFSRPLSLATRFAFAAAVILFNSMALMGGWVASRIESGVLQSAAGSSALYLESFVEPLTQDLAQQRNLSQAAMTSLDALLDKGVVKERLLAIKIWRPDGSIAYATNKSYVDRTFPVSKELAGALAGDVQTRYNRHLPDDRLKSTSHTGSTFEIYSPMHVLGTDRVIAVAQFHENADVLDKSLAKSMRDTWLTVGISTLVMLSLLYAIVRGGSRLIEKQKLDLENRIAKEEALNLQNTTLRQQLQIANRRGTELNERFLRRISSDLHDGPAQHLALALLRLDELVPVVKAQQSDGSKKNEAVLACIRTATADAMKEIRNISSGLALPELQKITPADALTIAARAHERATGTVVSLSISGLPQRLPLPLTICLFRFAQEGLNNAFRHAGAKDQRVRATSDGTTLDVEVHDGGPGCVPEQAGTNERIGLAGLRHRVETLGGTLHIFSEPGRGTRLSARFPIGGLLKSNA